MNPNRTAESKNGRNQRTQKLLDEIAETQRLNLVGIEFLRGIIEDHSDRVHHGVVERPDSNLIVYGELANYCIPLEHNNQARQSVHDWCNGRPTACRGPSSR